MHLQIPPRPRAIRQLVGVVTAAATAFALFAVLSVSAFADETKTFTGQKSCGAPVVTISPPAPGGYCLITESSLKILRGAKVYYTAALVAGGVLTSPVTLRATDRRGSTATGQCTYNLPTPTTPGHGLCVYSSGTGRLAGFHATVVVGPPIAGQRVYALTGTYWFDRRDDNDDD
jgi:hypothetical protein